MQSTGSPDSIACQTEIVQHPDSLVPCFWCERRHRGKHPLSVCAACRDRYSTMRALEMRGSFPLNDEAIEEALIRTSPGNYALGYLDGDAFVVFYIGRSDSDVRRSLHRWVGMPSRYDRYASPAKAPWERHRAGRLPLDAPASGRVGSSEDSYTRFAYSYAGTGEEAYAKQWRNYDAFGGRQGLDNEMPPVSTSDSGR